MLKPNSLQGIMQLNVDAQIVGIQFELVPRPQSAIFGHVHCQCGDRRIKRNAPVFVTRKIDLIIDELAYWLSPLRCDDIHDVLLLPVARALSIRKRAGGPRRSCSGPWEGWCGRRDLNPHNLSATRS